MTDYARLGFESQYVHYAALAQARMMRVKLDLVLLVHESTGESSAVIRRTIESLEAMQKDFDTEIIAPLQLEG